MLAARTAEIAKPATDKGLVRGDNPVPELGGQARAAVALNKDWYASARIRDQIAYYKDAVVRNQKAADELWWVAFAAGLAAVVAGALGVWQQQIAPWIGAATTVAASIAAYGLVDRRKYLVATCAAMQSRLEEILGLDKDAPMTFPDLVTTTEDLLDGEHKAWLPQMLGMQHTPAADSKAN